MEQLREVVDLILQQYQSMIVNLDEFMVENSQFAKEPGAIMDIMDSFYRLILLPLRVGPKRYGWVALELSLRERGRHPSACHVRTHLPGAARILVPMATTL